MPNGAECQTARNAKRRGMRGMPNGAKGEGRWGATRGVILGEGRWGATRRVILGEGRWGATRRVIRGEGGGGATRRVILRVARAQRGATEGSLSRRGSLLSRQ